VVYLPLFSQKQNIKKLYYNIDLITNNKYKQKNKKNRKYD